MRDIIAYPTTAVAAVVTAVAFGTLFGADADAANQLTAVNGEIAVRLKSGDARMAIIGDSRQSYYPGGLLDAYYKHWRPDNFAGFVNAPYHYERVGTDGTGALM